MTRRKIRRAQWSIHYRRAHAHSGHNLTTLESDTFTVGWGTMRRRLRAAVSHIASIGACGRLRRIAPAAASAVLCLALAHCTDRSRIDATLGVAPSARVVDPGEPIPKGGGVYRVGTPYMVAGRLYVPELDPHYRAEGLASWYGDDFHGRSTANGEIFDLNAISAAHPTMPLPSYARVTNLQNGRSLIVRVNDRGPYAANRIIDVSKHAAELLGFISRGTTRVRVEYVGPAQLNGSDDRLLEATLRQDEPAPAPGASVKLAAATRIVPMAMTLPPRTRVASTGSIAAALAADDSSNGDDTVQILNGRGLY
jgi:rare lipoprotein A (peptidoglycan hydrolase)